MRVRVRVRASVPGAHTSKCRDGLTGDDRLFGKLPFAGQDKEKTKTTEWNFRSGGYNLTRS